MKEADDKNIIINRLEGRLEELEELYNRILKKSDIARNVNFELAKFDGINEIVQAVINKVDSAVLSININNSDSENEIMNAVGHLIEVRNLAFEALGNQKGKVEKIVGVHETLVAMSDDISDRGRIVKDKILEQDWEKL